jgi:hypothetical protein
VLKHPVDDAGAEEAAHHRGAPRHSRRLELAHLLAPAHIQLQVHPLRGQRIQPPLRAPPQEHPQVRHGVLAGGAAVAREVRRHRHLQPLRRRHITGQRRQQQGRHPHEPHRRQHHRRRGRRRQIRALTRCCGHCAPRTQWTCGRASRGVVAGWGGCGGVPPSCTTVRAPSRWRLNCRMATACSSSGLARSCRRR